MNNGATISRSHDCNRDYYLALENLSKETQHKTNGCCPSNSEAKVDIPFQEHQALPSSALCSQSLTAVESLLLCYVPPCTKVSCALGIITRLLFSYLKAFPQYRCEKLGSSSESNSGCWCHEHRPSEQHA